MSTIHLPSPLVQSVVVEETDYFCDITGGEFRPAKPVKFHDDPLALSCSSYRLGQDLPSHPRWIPLDELKPIQADREMAADIRKYYLQQRTLRLLVGGKLTEFQTKMFKFLADEHELLENELGLLYRLPYFYTEDTDYDKILESVNSVKVETDEDWKHWSAVVDWTVTLTPIKRVLRSRKRAEVYEYWFRTSDNEAAMFSVEYKNSVKKLVDGLFDRPKITLHSVARVASRKDKRYWKLTNFELVI